jgi:hypothetical protein
MKTKILASIATLGLLLGLLVGGASARAVDDATLFLAHGIPGAKVDVYVSGDEVLSNWRYGRQAMLDELQPAVYPVKVRVASDGGRGELLVSASIELEAGDNVTAVAYLKEGAPFLKVFVNDVTFADDTMAILQVRHTANAPKVDVYANGSEITPGDGFTKGQEFGLEVAPGVYAYWVAAHGTFAPVIGPEVSELEATHAYQVMAVGTKPANHRFIVIAQDFTPVT